MDINIKTKYDLNQLIYVLHNNRIIIARIIDIHTITHNMEGLNEAIVKYYLVDGNDRTNRLGYYQENNMFDSKTQLLESL